MLQGSRGLAEPGVVVCCLEVDLLSCVELYLLCEGRCTVLGSIQDS
jgi:hypothetical protein